MTWLELFIKLKHDGKFKTFSYGDFKTGDFVEFIHPRYGKNVVIIIRGCGELFTVFPVFYINRIFSCLALPDELSKLDKKGLYNREIGIDSDTLEWGLNHHC